MMRLSTCLWLTLGLSCTPTASGQENGNQLCFNPQSDVFDTRRCEAVRRNRLALCQNPTSNIFDSNDCKLIRRKACANPSSNIPRELCPEKPPNILVIMVDEQRFPTIYDKVFLGDWLVTNLPGQQAIRAKSTELSRHYIGSAACVPSRATFFTGQYPTLHGTKATDGAAKPPHDMSMFWLDPNSVPTMGDYFSRAGYRTFYRGKWHIHHGDIEVPTTRDILRTNDEQGEVIPETTQVYERGQRLKDFGFSGWIGPDPHGSAQTNAGILRDPITADQVIHTIDTLEELDDDKPFLIVSSFLNPHDIVLFGALWTSWGYEYNDGTVPTPIPEPPTQDEDLSTKPPCQQDYVDKYGSIFLPQPQTSVYREFYYFLQKQVDQQVKNVWDRLQESRFANDTIVIYTSDHGEMLGAHGGMHQKWHQAYEETIRVPMLISGPGIPEGASLDVLSNHIDVIPTLLSMAGVQNLTAIYESLSTDHSEAQTLPGRDLTDIVLGMDMTDLPVYFITEDEVSEGPNQQSVLGPYEAIIEPAKVEAVVARMETVVNGNTVRKLWKLARSYEDSLIDPPVARTNNEVFELYDLDMDPTEVVNLAWPDNETELSRLVLPQLKALLVATRNEKAKMPETMVGEERQWIFPEI